MENIDGNEDIKNITREAEYLLQQLSAGIDELEPVANESSMKASEIILASKSQSEPKTSPEESDKTINAEQSNLGTVVGSLAALFFLAALIMPLVNQRGTSTSDPPSAPSDDIAGLTRLEHDSKNAVLICELRPIIDRANSLSLSNQTYVARKNKIISDANKSIASLDASSAKGYKYWEDSSCTWGEQWFDKHNENSFRAFIALSKKCANPRLYYKHTRDKEGKTLVAQESLGLSGHRTGEIAIPYYPGNNSYYVFIKNVSCN